MSNEIHRTVDGQTLEYTDEDGENVITLSMLRALADQLEARDADAIALNDDLDGQGEQSIENLKSLGTEVSESGQSKLNEVPESFENTRSMEHLSLQPSPLIGSSTEDISSTPWPTNSVGEYVLGWVEEGGSYEIYRSDDDGSSWSKLANAPGGSRPRHILETDDGEILVAVPDGVHKSSGYPNNITWSEVLSIPDDTSLLRTWSIDGDGSTYIAAHYADGDRSDSRFAWASNDAGNSWDVIYDSVEEHPNNHQNMHLHGCAYDPWADRYWVIDAHSDTHNVFYSDDGGSNWNTPSWESPLGTDSGMPTTIIAARKGMVLGSDTGGQLGIYVIPRTEEPEDQVVRFAYEFPSKRGAVALIARSSRLDNRTGVAYVGFTGENAHDYSLRDDPAIIAASDGVTGGLVWQEPNPTDESRIAYFALTPGDQRLVGVLERDDATDQYLQGLLGQPGVQPPAYLDPGGVLGGERPEMPGGVRYPSVAGGQSAIAHRLRSVVFGSGVEAEFNDSTIFGYDISFDGRGVAVGNDINTDSTRLVAIGNHLNVANDNDFQTVIGWKAESLGVRSVAIGSHSTARAESVAVGQGSFAHNRGVACGRDANSVLGSIAIGRQASANSGGIAIGTDAEAGENEMIVYLDDDPVFMIDAKGDVSITGNLKENTSL